MIWDFVKQKAQSLLHNSVEAVQKRFMVWFSHKYGANKKHRDYMVCYAKHQLELHARIAFYEYMSAKIALRSEDEIQRLKKTLDNLIMESDALGWGKLKTDALIGFSISSEGQKIIANIEEMTRCAVGLHELFESEAYQNHKEATAQFFREQMLEKRKQDILALMQTEQNQTDTSELEEFKIFARENNYRVFDTGLAGYLQALPNDELEALQFWMDGNALEQISSFPTERSEEQGISGVLSAQDSLPNFLTKIYGNDENGSSHADANRHSNTNSEMDSDFHRSDEKGESRHSCEGRNLDQNAKHFNNHNNDNISALSGQGLDACLRRHDENSSRHSEQAKRVWLSSQSLSLRRQGWKHFICMSYDSGLPRRTKVLLWVTAYNNFGMVRQAQGTNLYKPPPTQNFKNALFPYRKIAS